MIQSREIALRCAASLPDHLLFRRWHGEEWHMECERYGLNPHKAKPALIEQLDACKDDAARRLLLGRSR